MKSRCPYCNKDLGKEIKRKIACPSCGKTIYVRHGNPVTEREKEIFDWQLYMDFLVPDINEIRNSVEKRLTERFRKQSSASDLVWGMFNHIITKLRKPDDLSLLYQNMATFLESEGKHQQADNLKRESLKASIVGFRDSSFEHIIKIRNKEDGFVCEVCKKLNGKAFTLDEGTKEPPVPVLGCQNKMCRCWADFVMKDEGESNNENTDREIVITIKREENENKSSGGFFRNLFKGKK